MSWKEQLLEQGTKILKDRVLEPGSKILENPAVMRWVTDDRVMKAAEGLMDAPIRLKAALKILKEGYDLPNVDPALDDDPKPARKNGAAARSNGHYEGTNGVAVRAGDAEGGQEQRCQDHPGADRSHDRSPRFSPESTRGPRERDPRDSDSAGDYLTTIVPCMFGWNSQK